VRLAEGVKRIYGLVGDSSPMTIRRQGKIKWIHVRHEEIAAFAASGG
jgi:pyruvate dehydrogenase (quinone)